MGNMERHTNRAGSVLTNGNVIKIYKAGVCIDSIQFPDSINILQLIDLIQEYLDSIGGCSNETSTNVERSNDATIGEESSGAYLELKDAAIKLVNVIEADPNVKKNNWWLDERCAVMEAADRSDND